MILTNLRKLIEEPVKNRQVRFRLRTNCLRFIIFSTHHLEIRHNALLIIIVLHNVEFHVLKVQAPENVQSIVSTLLVLRNNRRITRIIAAGFLKHLVLFGTKLTGLGVELLGHLDGVVLVIDLDVSHNAFLFLSGALPLSFLFEGVVPFVVITVYNNPTSNQSL